jgi:phosphopantetheinyl transferase (holo-ACP synthase)
MYVGNDIVAHQHPRCIDKWKQVRFLEKVLQPIEIEQLYQQYNKHNYLWMLWTLKEAAYKLSCFLGNRNKFHAQQFTIAACGQLEDIPNFVNKFPLNNTNDTTIHSIQNEIHFDRHTFYGFSLIGEQFIHSMVTTTATLPKHICWGIQNHELVNKDDYSTAVRHFAMLQLAQQNIHVYAMEKDKDGIPFVKLAYGREKYISLSHDQQFVSYAYAL